MANPAEAAAQQPGSARAAVPAAAGRSADQRAKKPLPPVIQRIFAGRDLPPGLRNRAPEASSNSEPAPEPAPAPDPEPPCEVRFDPVLMLPVDCHGNPVQAPGVE